MRAELLRCPHVEIDESYRLWHLTEPECCGARRPNLETTVFRDRDRVVGPVGCFKPYPTPTRPVALDRELTRHDAENGWRVQVHCGSHGVELLSKNGKDLTARFGSLAAELKKAMGSRQIVLDGELVASDIKGCPDFRALHGASKRSLSLTIWAFDLLVLDAVNFRPLPLTERKASLNALLAEIGSPTLRYSDHFEDGEALLVECVKLGLEGIVSKRRDEPYQSGKTQGWRKIKTAEWRAANADRWAMFQR